jgi:hypothetical protein
MFTRLSRARQGALALLAFFALTASQCAQNVSTPPGQWSVVNTHVNANSPDVSARSPRTTVFFSQNKWQDENRRDANFAHGWMNDVLVEGEFAFQVEVSGAQFFSGGLILKDVATGRELTARQARVNRSFDCGPPLPRPAPPADPNSPPPPPAPPPQPSSSVQCYHNPGSSRFVPRPALPTNETSYTIELVQVCRGQLRYTDLRCPAAQNGDPNGPQAPLDAVLLLTISPPTAPAKPAHGQKFEYELISRTRAGETPTRLTAIYVEPGRCTLQSLQATPIKGPVGAQVNVQWFAQDCRSIEIRTNDPGTPVLSSQIAPADAASLPSLNGSRPFQLGSDALTVRFTAVAHDSMGRLGGQRTAAVEVEPCSISKTHPRCETRCQATPAPAGCPQPPPPACPVGEGDANRQLRNFEVSALCVYGPQWSENRVVTEPACTEQQAQQSVKAQLGPSCTVATGRPVSQECPNGAMKRDWKFCLRCAASAPNSLAVTHDETAKACYLPDAVEMAKRNRPNNICWLQNEGACPK